MELQVSDSRPGDQHEQNRASVVAVKKKKNLPEMQDTQEFRVQSLGREDPLEEGMRAHSSILAWRIPWTGEPGRL